MAAASHVTDDEQVRGLFNVAESQADLDIAQPATHSRAREAATPLKGRRGETEALDHLLKAIRSGPSRALVMYGEPGSDLPGGGVVVANEIAVVLDVEAMRDDDLDRTGAIDYYRQRAPLER